MSEITIIKKTTQRKSFASKLISYFSFLCILPRPMMTKVDKVCMAAWISLTLICTTGEFFLSDMLMSWKHGADIYTTVTRTLVVPTYTILSWPCLSYLSTSWPILHSKNDLPMPMYKGLHLVTFLLNLSALCQNIIGINRLPLSGRDFAYFLCKCTKEVIVHTCKIINLTVIGILAGQISQKITVIQDRLNMSIENGVFSIIFEEKSMISQFKLLKQSLSPILLVHYSIRSWVFSEFLSQT